jgi:fatty acid desaturase
MRVNANRTGQASEMCMNRDVLRALKLRRQGAAVGRLSGRRIATTCLIALFTTGVWWIILYFGGWAVGYPISEAWLFSVLAGIFLLLVLGLSMAAMATNTAPDAPRGAKQDTVAEPPHHRRNVG